MILIQVKGGNARWPTESDIARLRAVAQRYNTRAVVLAEHRTGKQPTVYRLKEPMKPWTHRGEWEVADAAQLFR
jgi:hypothetical protein